MSEKVAEDSLRTGRIICAISAVVYPGYWLAEAGFGDRLIDPLEVRFAMTAAVVTLLGWSFASSFVRRHFRAFLRGFVYLTTAHVFGLLVLNQLDQAVVIGVFVVLASFITVAPHLMSTVQQLLAYTAFVLGLAVVTPFAVAAPRVPPEYFLLSVVAVVGFAFVSVRAQLRSLEKLIESERGLIRDVESRERAEAELKNSEAHARALLDANPDVLLRLGGGGIVLDVRASETAPFGSALRGALGDRLDAWLSHAMPRSVAETVEHVLGSGGVGNVSAAWLGGSVRRQFEVRIARAHGDECLAVARDVTDDREVELRMRAADRLVSLGTLASGVAHEINNPLAYVNANVDYALGALENSGAGGLPVEPDVVDALREAKDGGQRIANIVSSLKREARQADEPLGAVDVSEAVGAAVRLLDNQLRYRAVVQLSVVDVPPVVANAQRLVQIVVNLLTNAIDAFPERPTEENHVRIAVAPVASEHVAIDVTDNGTGVPESARDRIFDPFFTTKAQGVGTGLGLYLSHQFAASFGGALTIVSTSPHGSTFRVTLKVAEVPKPVPAEGPSASVPPCRVLVVDDEPLVARAIARLLRRQEIVVAADGEKAIELCRTGSFDLILCDMMMPRLDGAGFYAELKRSRPDLVPRVAFMTGGAFTPDAQQFLETVESPRLDKPIDGEKLRAIARSIVVPALEEPRAAQIDSQNELGVGS